MTSPPSVRYLLDTHVLLWLLTTPERIPGPTRDVLAEHRNEICVSAISALEIAAKVRVGKLAAPTLPDTLIAEVQRIGATTLPVGVDHALLAGSMRWDHRDPFDRVLVAQARLERAVLVTVDRAITALEDLPTLTW